LPQKCNNELSLYYCAAILWHIYVTYNNKIHLGLQVKCLVLLSDINQIWIFLIDFHISLQYQIWPKSM